MKSRRSGRHYSLFFAAMCLAGCEAKEKPVSAEEAARREHCPELATWGECESKLRRGNEEAFAARKAKTEAAAANARAQIAAEWAAYDASRKKDKAGLFATVKSAMDLVSKGPPELAPTLTAEVRADARKRMAPLIRPESRTTGQKSEVLVPNSQEAPCLVWGSMWTNDDETVEALASLGFEEVRCAKKTWSVREALATCHLYWNPGQDHESSDPVNVWSSQEIMARARVVGERQGDEAIKQYLALVSKGASIMVPGGEYRIVDRGDGWLRVSGVGAHAGVSGFVEPEACHRKQRKGG